MAQRRTKAARSVKAEPATEVADAVEEAVELTVEAMAEDEVAKETVGHEPTDAPEPERPVEAPSAPVEARTGPETTDGVANAVTALLRRPRPRECPATLLRFKDGPAVVTVFVDAPSNIVSEAWTIWSASGGDQKGLVALISKTGAPVRYVRYIKELNLD